MVTTWWGRRRFRTALEKRDAERAEAALARLPDRVPLPNLDRLFVLTMWLGYYRVAVALLRRGANPNLPLDQHDARDVHVERANDTKSRFIVSFHAGTSMRPAWVQLGHGVRPVHLASQGGALDLVEALLAAGADPWSKTDRGNTALSLAPHAAKPVLLGRFLSQPSARVGREDLLPILLDACRLKTRGFADLVIRTGLLTTDDLTEALRVATEQTASEVAFVLLDHGAKPTGPIIRAAVEKRNTDLVVKLVEVAAIPVPVIEVDAELIYSLALVERRDLIAKLLASRISVDSMDRDGFTALHRAATEKNGAAVSLLLALGANVDVTTAANETALMLAARKGADDIVRDLLSHGADPRREDRRGRTAARHAWASGHAEMARQLAESREGVVAGGLSEELTGFIIPAVDDLQHQLSDLMAQFGAPGKMDAVTEMIAINAWFAVITEFIVMPFSRIVEESRKLAGRADAISRVSEMGIDDLKSRTWSPGQLPQVRDMVGKRMTHALQGLKAELTRLLEDARRERR